MGALGSSGENFKMFFLKRSLLVMLSAVHGISYSTNLFKKFLFKFQNYYPLLCHLCSILFVFQLMILKEQNNQKRTQADGMPDINHDQENPPSTNGKVGTKTYCHRTYPLVMSGGRNLHLVYV